MARVLSVGTLLCGLANVATAFGPAPGSQCINVTANTCCKPNTNHHLVTITNVTTAGECCGICRNHSRCTVGHLTWFVRSAVMVCMGLNILT